MASRDLLNEINPMVAIAPVVVADNTAQASGAIDTKGFESVTFVILTGTLADADAEFTVTVKDGADATQGNHTAVDDVHLVGTEALAGFDQDADSACRKIGYKGGQRYVSIEVVPTGNAAAAPLSVVAILGHPHDVPTSNPPT